MARSKKKTKLTDLPAQSDPSTELDSATFLRAAQPVLKQLESDLIARAKASSMVTAALKARHASEKASKRTADTFAQWQQNFIDQVAAAWLLSCVFVRTLEDRGLLGHPRIAGPGAADSQKMFFQMAPSLTERDYLLTVFRELTHFEAARDLFDTKHNPVWLLAPSAEAAKALLALFRTPSSDTPAFRFGQPDTRFLGDLYQDLNERVRKRYALLQTPRFVESFILDRTLERAIERFGLDDTTVIDPTCGSGHFLLGSFDRLYEHRLRSEPGLDPRQAAHKAMDAVFGADINPYAVGIARFRLTLSFLEKAGFKKLADAPQLPLHLVVADSLLHNPHLHQIDFADLEDQSIRAWKGEEFELEDENAARDVLHRKYAVVVGNPPYITANDRARSKIYRSLYRTAYKQYHLSVPFTERFFSLTREQGYVGVIESDGFMKREFGKPFVEEYLPTVNLDLIVNTSGAYIPGHGTPTVMLFGTAEPARGTHVHSVLAKRGEPGTPADPEKGLVWSSVVSHWQELGYEDDFISVERVDRPWLEQHPWILAGGGVIDLVKHLEASSSARVDDLAGAIGRTTVAGEDDVWISPAGNWARRGLEKSAVPLVIGEIVRDWRLGNTPEVLYPYKSLGGEPVDDSHDLLRALWPWRTLLANRTVFGKRMRTSGRPWWEHLEHYAERLRTPLTITFAFVATHNHFVLDHGGKVFKRSAPIIKLPDGATEDDHLALLAYLNSSTACFLLKQVCFRKYSANQKHNPDPSRHKWEFDATKLSALPVPELRKETLAKLAREAGVISTATEQLRSGRRIKEAVVQDRLAPDLAAQFAATWDEWDALQARLVALQEEIDWLIYSAFGLSPESMEQAVGQAMKTLDSETEVAPGGRPFERQAGHHQGFTERVGKVERRLVSERDVPARWLDRERFIQEGPLAVIEQPEFKRTWRFSEQNIHPHEARTAAEEEVARTLILDMIETHLRSQSAVVTSRELTAAVRCEAIEKVMGYFDREVTADNMSAFIENEAVPFSVEWRLSADGLGKFQQWERTWDLQRGEDAGTPQKEAPVPPAYARNDFRDSAHWRLRGKLDVPKERFISYPGCESDDNGEPVYGWAGWNHLERMQALAALYQQRKKEGWRGDKEPNTDGDKDDRLIPMLAGLLELLPWVKQWHNEPSEEFDGLRLGDYFERFINGECRELGLTHDDLKGWRPADKKSRRRKKRGS